ncbi:MAG: PcfB family protein [Clostridia bacterium]|nr:PcfB family protein [Clostridia bacterium]MBQ6466884.1 PcfB family protein [Clostridia bacterium]
MQEEVQNKTITLAINTSKLTARELKQALEKFLAYQKNRHNDKAQTKDVIPRGKQTVKQLAAQNQGMTNIEITDKNIRTFDRVARKYGVDYAVKKDKTVDPPKYLVFFKAKDTDALTAAFKDYTRKTVRSKARKDSVLDKLSKAKEAIKAIPAKVKHKELER